MNKTTNTETTTTTVDTDSQIRALHDFAWECGEANFAHMCTAALNGEAWAVERVNAAVTTIRESFPGPVVYTGRVALNVIVSTDATPPGGGALRSLDNV